MPVLYLSNQTDQLRSPSERASSASHKRCTSVALDSDERKFLAQCDDIRRAIREDVAFIMHREIGALKTDLESRFEVLGHIIETTDSRKFTHLGFSSEVRPATMRSCPTDFGSTIAMQPSTKAFSNCYDEQSTSRRTRFSTVSKVSSMKSQSMARESFGGNTLEDSMENSKTIQSYTVDSDTLGSDRIGGRMSIPSVPDVFKAVERGAIDEVRYFLDAFGDPNVEIQSYKIRNRPYINCTLLPVAVMGKHVELVRLLIERGASVNSKYGMLAGSVKMKWHSSAIFATVPKGNLSLMKELVQLKADPHEYSSNNSNLVWQCCYFGQSDMLTYLLEIGVAHDRPGYSQDLQGVSHTPLHMATMQGNEVIVELLLLNKAEPNVQNEECETPLTTAIRLEHPSVIRLLVRNGAAIVGNDTLYTLFQKRNPVLLHSAARGLFMQESQVRSLSTEDVLQFLSIGSTDSLQAMFEAIFREREIRYRGTRLEKIVSKTAYLRKTLRMPGGLVLFHINSAESDQTHADLEAAYIKRLPPNSAMLKLLSNLLPPPPSQEDSVSRKFRGLLEHERHYTSVSVFESVVPNFHTDLRVMRAIKEVSPFDPLLEQRQCRAIIRSASRKTRWLLGLELFSHVALLLVFCGFAVYHQGLSSSCAEPSLQKNCDEESVKASRLGMTLVAVAGSPFYLFEVLRELLEFLAHVKQGWHKEYLANAGNIVDILRIGVDGWVLSTMLIWPSDEFEYGTRVFFASSCFFKWMKTLFCLTPVRTFGFSVMPLLFSMLEIGPMLLIMCFYFAGVSHAYIAMHFSNEHSMESGLNVFFYGMVGFDYPPSVKDPRFNAVQLWLTRLILLAVTFVVPITLMNIFIAAMNSSYARCRENIERLYQSRLSNSVFNHMMVQDMAKHLCRRRAMSIGATYLWYCHELVAITQTAQGASHERPHEEDSSRGRMTREPTRLVCTGEPSCRAGLSKSVFAPMDTSGSMPWPNPWSSGDTSGSPIDSPGRKNSSRKLSIGRLHL